MLPFLVEQYGPESRPRYLVSKINTDAVDDPDFQPGVELEAWNGTPFTRAVENHADLETGGRPDSRRSRALESLTFRALDYGPPPDEHWVIVGYRTKRGRKSEIRLPWRLLTPGKAATAGEPGSRAALKQAGDLSAEAVRRAKKLVFATDLWANDHERRTITEWRSAVTDLRTVVTSDPDGDNSGPNYGARFSETDYAPIPRGDLPYGVPSWLGDDSRGRQSRPRRRNTVERDPADLMHTLIWRAPTG